MAFTLTVNGSGFTSTAVVRWNGSDRVTTFVSNTQVQIGVTAADISTVGTAQLTVFNPLPGGGISNAWTFPITENPVPAISSLSPISATAGRPAFTVTVTGGGFVAGSVVRWNGASRATTFDSATQLRASIPAADIATAGAASITVLNPAPGGGLSNTAVFTIVNNPTPWISSTNPAYATGGGAGFTVTVTGTGFASGSTVRWNGNNRGTTFDSATQLRAAISAADIAAGGAPELTVFNPAPGGGTSNAWAFTVNGPSLSSMSPNIALVGGAGFTLTVAGTGFNSGSVVRWNGADRTTTFNSSSQVRATIAADDIAVAGTAQVTVSNPGSGGGLSNALTFLIPGTANPVPALSSISPATAGAGGSGFTLIANGTDFVPFAVVRWNGADRATTFLGATQLAAAITAADIAAAGTAQVTVFNPAPGGGTSAAQAFSVTAACNYSLSASSATHGAGAETGSVAVTTLAGCAWAAASNASWSAITAGSAGSGSGAVSYLVAANTTTSSRVGTLTIAGQTFTITQAAANLVTAGAAQGMVGGTARVLIMLALSSGVNVNSVNFGLSIAPNGSAPALAGTLSFQPDAALGAPTSVNTSGGPGLITVIWQGPTPLLSGTARLGEVVVVVPATAAPGQSYTLYITAAGGSMGASPVTLTPGPNSTLLVVSPYPVPILSSLAPTSATVGGSGFTLTVNGTNFVNGSVVRWNGADRGTTFVNATQLTAAIPAGDLTAAGTAQVTVFNPAPGGGTSNAVSFPINLAATPASVVKISGEPQAGVVGTALPAPLVVQVNSAAGAGIPGAAVNFAVTGGSASLLPTTAIANAAGQAQTAVTLGTVAGPVTVSASVAGVFTPAVFTLTATPGPPASLTIASGDNQTGPAGTTLPLPLVVKVTDANSNPVPDVTVLFSVASGGGSLSDTSVQTDGGGRAQVTWRLGGIGVAHAVHASAGTLPVVTFHASAAVGPPANLAIESGNNQTAVAGSTLPSPLVVKVTDQYGNLLSGITVNFAVTGGGGSLSAASVVTAANGQVQVTWTLGSIEGNNTAQASVGTLTPVLFAATGTAATTAVGTVAPAAASGSPGTAARVPITLTLSGTNKLDSLAFGLKVDPNGTALGLTDPLSFATDVGMPAATLVDPVANTISVTWLNLATPLSGTIRLGEVVVPIPSLAIEGQTYTVRITGASGSKGTVQMTLLPGANATISVTGRGYLVGDVFPVPSAAGDWNGDGTYNEVGEFGDDQLQILDLIYALRAVTSVPGYRPPACSDRFDAVDSHPADTPSVRGGNGMLNTVDLIYTLRRVTSVDTSRPRRYTRGLVCPAGAGPEAVAQAFQPAGPADPAGSLRLGEPREVAVGVWQVPVYLEARGDLDLAGLSFALAIDNQPGTRWLRFVAGERSGDLRVAMKAPTLVDAGLPGVLAVAWLDGLQVAAGQRLLLGYVEIAGAEAGRLPAATLQFHGISANAPDGSEVRVSPLAPREQM